MSTSARVILGLWHIGRGHISSYCTHVHYDHWEASGLKVKVQALQATDDH